MTESLKDKVKQLVNEGNAREAISLLQNQADQGDGQAQEHIFDVGHPIVTAFQRRGSSATKDVVSVKSTAK